MGSSGSDEFGRIEQHGIDRVPDTERHGRPLELFAVWAAANTTYIFFVVGGALPLMGLTVWQSCAAIVLGNLFWVLVGLLAPSGAASGTPGSVVMRAMFGVRANRMNLFFSIWLIAVAYEAINLALGCSASFALMDFYGHPARLVTKLCIVLITAAATLTISVYGHATIVSLSGPFTAVLTVGFILLAMFVWPHANFAQPLAASGVAAARGPAFWAAFFGGITVVASGPLSWSASADYARYLPAGTRAFPIALWTTLGGFAPSILLSFTGVLAATAVNMTDTQTALRAILPAWFYPIFLLLIAASSITNNVLNAYSSGLSLQAMGVHAARSLTVIADGLIAVALTIYALLISNFLETLSSALSLSVSLLGPSLAIYGTDVVLRRNRYDGRALTDEAPGSPFWYKNGIYWPGVGALAAGTSVSLLCVNTPYLTGPMATYLAGADISTLAGPLAAVFIYAGLTKKYVLF